MRGLRIRTDLSAAELRALARRDTRPRAAPRLYAIAQALDGISRADGRALRHVPSGVAGRGCALQCVGRERLGRPAAARSPTAADRGRVGGPGGADLPRSGPRAERVVELDARRSLP